MTLRPTPLAPSLALRRGSFAITARRLVAPLVAAVALVSTLAVGDQALADRGPSPAEVQATAGAHQQVALLAHELTMRERFLGTLVASEFSGKDASQEQAAPVDADAARITGLAAEVPSLAMLERGQLAEVEQLNRTAEARAAVAERAIRRTGLNPRLVVAKADDRAAQGGPLEAFADGNPTDARFAQLGATVARMSALERGLDSIPTHLPASLQYISSGFGYRSDPFTGEGAMHAGLDFRGPVGAPIQAAADGVVSFAGVKGGYGNCIEITHANGLMTRYGHMSAFKARLGQKVVAGDTIGAIGSTGRSTGPHLHFEVRVNGVAVNPRPFLEARA
jgi:murein DD-endopeptidase MepM/ murein hydrolase activator NlpD